jgi:hypothetical protein
MFRQPAGPAGCESALEYGRRIAAPGFHAPKEMGLPDSPTSFRRGKIRKQVNGIIYKTIVNNPSQE